MNDRELLELAAKAAGIAGQYFWSIDDAGIDCGDGKTWSPLDDDGDALRLAVKLRMNILFNGSRYHVGPDRFVMDICREGGMSEIRHSIVLAAAEIGKEIK